MVSNVPSGEKPVLIAPGMRVVDINGKSLGTVDTAVYDERNEQLSSFTVQHGLMGRKHRTLPGHLAKTVAEGVVTLRISAAEFKELGEL